jgi:hypothetical protein
MGRAFLSAETALSQADAKQGTAALAVISDLRKEK